MTAVRPLCLHGSTTMRSSATHIRSSFRVAAALLLLAFAVVGAVRAYCPMPAALAESGTPDPHGCCRSGVAENTPSCCHSDDAPTPARMANGAAAAPSILRSHLPGPLDVTEAVVGPPSRPTHAAPPLVLRV